MNRGAAPGSKTLSLDPDRNWFHEARRLDSPNCDARPAGASVDLVVIHNISLPPGRYRTGCVERFFCNELPADEHPFFEKIKEMRVSSHLFIERDGALTQFVPLGARAWHAGVSEFRGRHSCNDFSIGIELEGCDHQPYEDAQYLRLGQVLGVLFQAWPALDASKVVGHSDIAPGRKTDPGPAFDWARARSELPRAAS